MINRCIRSRQADTIACARGLIDVRSSADRGVVVGVVIRIRIRIRICIDISVVVC